MLFAPVSVATAAAHAIVAAPASPRRIRVLGYVLAAAGAVTVKWSSATTDLTGAMSLATGVPQAVGPAGLPVDPFPVLQCAAGEALNLTLGGAVQVSGWVIYDLAE